jgi:hypothetical protein
VQNVYANFDSPEAVLESVYAQAGVCAAIAFLLIINKVPRFEKPRTPIFTRSWRPLALLSFRAEGQDH